MSDCSGFQEKFWRQKSTIRPSAINGKMKADETFAVRHPPTKRLQLFHFLFFWCIVLLSGRNLVLGPHLIHLCPYFEGKKRQETVYAIVELSTDLLADRTKFDRPIGVDKLCGGVMDCIVRRRPQGKSNRMPSLAALRSHSNRK